MKLFFSNISETKKGELAIFGESVLSSLLPVLGLLTFKSLPPLHSLFFSLVFTIIFFAIFLFYKKSWQNIFKKENLKNIFWIVLLIGIGYYGLSFIGLQYTSANNASIIWQSELLFSFLFFNIWRREQITTTHILGAVLMLCGVVLIFFPQIQNYNLNKGDILILIATTLPPIGNYFQRDLRSRLSSTNIIFWRSLLTLPFIFLLMYFAPHAEANLNLKVLIFLAFNGLLVFGLAKILWLESIIRIPIPKANSLASVRPFLTMLFSFVLLGQKPDLWQISSAVPIILGVILLTKE